MSHAALNPATISAQEVVCEMPRKREQNGWWVASKTTWTLEYRKYGVDGDPKAWELAYEQIGLKREIGKRMAEQLRKTFMEDVNAANRRPSSLMSVSQFWPRFEEQVIRKKKASGQKHYRWFWKILEPIIGRISLADFTPDHVEMVVRVLSERGYSGQTVLHAKNVISALFKHAKRRRLYHHDNPASLVEIGEIRHEKRPTYTESQLRLVLGRLPSPVLEMAQLAVATSMGPAEMCGITLQWCNLTDRIKLVDGSSVLAPYCIAVKENVYEGKRGSLKASSRERIEPITPDLAAALRLLVARSKRQDETAPLFQSKKGTPIDSHNISNRVFKPLAQVLGFSVTWYAFRRAHSSLAAQIPGISVDDRVRAMGHADARMTMYYNVAEVERRRQIPEKILEMLMGEPEGRA